MFKLLRYFFNMVFPPDPNLPDPLLDKVTGIVLQRNNAAFPTVNVKQDLSKGTILNKITMAQAEFIATVLISAAKSSGLPLPYLMACVCVESLFDPACKNGNFLGSNPTKAQEGYDVGICQLKLKYLLDPIHLVNVDDAQAFALNVSKAIPYAASLMQAHVTTATTYIKANNCLVPYNNKYYTGSAIYNFGFAGFVTKLAAMKPITTLSHCEGVKQNEQIFCQKLNQKSIF